MDKNHWLNKISIQLMQDLDAVPFSENADEIKKELILKAFQQVPAEILKHASRKSQAIRDKYCSTDPTLDLDSKLNNNIIRPIEEEVKKPKIQINSSILRRT